MGWGEMDIKEKASLLAIHAINGIGNKTLFNIKEEFGSFAVCLEADSKKLHKIFTIDSIYRDISAAKNNYMFYMDGLLSQGIDCVTIEDETYPDRLRNISNPPYLLYTKGDISLLKEFCIGAVGSRAATAYGKRVAFNFGRELAGQDIVTVSGMARGIDAEVHKGTLAGKGKTIAVLGSGINIIYPKDNTNLYREIAETGLIISEIAPGYPPEPGNFPARNRIISGLSYGVLVIEAKIRSGALITIDFALEQGRDVFAIPGPITSQNSEGTNNLIKQGAKPTTCIEDILEEYYDIRGQNSHQVMQNELPLLEDDEVKLVNVLDFTPSHFDQILTDTNLSVGELSMLLLNLEFKGIVKSMPGNYYVKVTDYLK